MVNNKNKPNLLKCFQISILIVAIAFSTSCWDKIEIDERAFVLGIAVDMADGSATSKSTSDSASLSGEEISGKIDKKDYIKTLFFMPIPSKLIAGAVDTYTTEESEGRNIPSAIQSLSMHFSRKMFFGQTRVILIGENLMKNEKAFREFVDFLEREPDMGRDAKIAVFKGKIDALKNIKPKFEKVFAAYAIGVFKNSNREASTLQMSTNEVLSELRDNNGKCILPVISADGEDIKLTKLALMKEFKFKDYLDMKYLRPLTILTNSMENGIILVPYNGNEITFKIKFCDTKIKVEPKSNNLKYKITAKIEGDVDNYLFNMDMFEVKNIKNAQNKIKMFVEDELKKTIAHFQNDIGTDYLALEEFTKKHKYEVYQKYKKNWEDEFRKASFEYDVSIFIRRLGGVKR